MISIQEELMDLSSSGGMGPREIEAKSGLEGLSSPGGQSAQTRPATASESKSNAVVQAMIKRRYPDIAESMVPGLAAKLVNGEIDYEDLQSLDNWERGLASEDDDWDTELDSVTEEAQVVVVDDRVAQADAQDLRVNQAQQEIAMEAVEQVRQEMVELASDHEEEAFLEQDYSPALHGAAKAASNFVADGAQAPPQRGRVKQRYMKLKQKFNDFKQRHRLRNADITQTTFKANLEQLVAGCGGSKTKLRALGKALQEQLSGIDRGHKDLKTAQRSHLTRMDWCADMLNQGREPNLTGAFSKVADALVFNAPFSKPPGELRPLQAPHGSPSDDHPALSDPSAQPFSVRNETDYGRDAGMLRCKGYIQEGQYSGDWIATEHYETHSVSVAADSAGNTQGNHEGAKALTRSLVDGLNQIVVQHGHDPDAMKSAIAKLLVKLDTEQSERIDNEGANEVTVAFSLRINAEDGSQLAIGGTMGDARILYGEQDGSVSNLTPSEFDGTASDSGGALGANQANRAGGGDLTARVRNGQHPLMLFARVMQPNEFMMLGSDGLGDNLEAKTVGLSPREAFEALPENVRMGLNLRGQADALPQSTDDWTNKALRANEDLAHDLQQIHAAFIEVKAAELLQADDPLTSMFNHCASPERYAFSIRAQDIEARSAQITKIASEEVRNLSDEEQRQLTELRAERLELAVEIAQARGYGAEDIEILRGESSKARDDLLGELFKLPKSDDVGITMLTAAPAR